MKRCAHRGFTLVELMVVCAVVAVLLMLAAPSFNDFILLQRLKGINAQVVTDMQLARSEAAARNQNVFVRFGADAGGTCYVLFTGTPTACNCDAAPLCSGGGTEVRTVRVANTTGVQVRSNMNRIEFDAPTGRIVTFVSDDEIGLLTIISIDTFIDTARKLRIEMSLAGRPSVCRPTGSTMTGLPC